MLSSLYIKNFVIISEVKLDFAECFTAITGDTGSGKSLILDAINFCITGACKQDQIFNGEDYALVTLSFQVNNRIKTILEENSIFIDDEVHVTRVISKDGKKRCNINNQPASQKLLDLFIDDVITIYAQHSMSKLFKPSYHIKILDDFAKLDKQVLELQKIFREIKNYQKELEDHKIDYEKNAREFEFLSHMAKEIKDAKILDNEEEELASKRIMLQNLSKKTQLIKDIADSFSNNGISSALNSLIRQLTRAPDNEIFNGLIEQLDIAANHISNAEIEIEKLQESEFSERSLEEIEDRLFSIKALARKYNCSSAKLNELLGETEEKISSFTNSASIIKLLEKKIKDSKEKFISLAKELSVKRNNNAKILMKKVSDELKFLNMANCDFMVDVEALDDDKYTERGIDNVVFKAYTNPGSPHSPIDKIASGGEMARFMLALQVSLLEASSEKPCIIFDEIDTGIGGKVADSVGFRLKKLSLFAKVIVITHQPQVASKSDQNILVFKESDDKKTISSARLLNHDEKINEIARMLSGKEITIEAISAAKQLIASS